jgi:hypothetical protein
MVHRVYGEGSMIMGLDRRRVWRFSPRTCVVFLCFQGCEGLFALV